MPPARVCGILRRGGACTVSRQRRSAAGLHAISLAIPIVLALVLAACASDPSGTASPGAATAPVTPSAAAGKDVKTIYVAGGCFWGLEKYIGLVHGVVATEVGYANGAKPPPPTETAADTQRPSRSSTTPRWRRCRSCSACSTTPSTPRRRPAGQRLRHRVPYRYLLHGPRRQSRDRQVAGATAEGLRGADRGRERPLTNYTAAEDYHQDYLEKNPGGYCHIPQKLFDAAAVPAPEAPPDPPRYQMLARASSSRAMGDAPSIPNAAANAGRFDTGLFTRARAGECGSVLTIRCRYSSV